MIKLLLLLLLLTFCLPHLVFARASRINLEYRANSRKVTEKIIIDGQPQEKEWLEAKRYELKYDIYPGDNIPTKVKTEFSTIRDEENVYFAFYCYDNDPSQIRAHLSERDKIFNDDFIILIIDAFKDNQRVYEYAVNPFGVQGDLLRMANNEDETYDALWYSAGKKTEYGYFVEMALPFKALRFPSDNSAEWGLQVLRIHPRESRYTYSWTPSDRNNPCMMCQAGVLEGMDGIKSKMTYELLPYFAGFQSSSLKDEDAPGKGLHHNNIQGRAGISLKATPSSELVIEGVVNPDFSQIESDAQQISVNSTFALFYPEKRPFFLEGAEIFSTNMNTFHSRMINNPLFALKGTGKKGRLSYALLTAQDRNSVFIVPGEEESDYVETDKKSFITIGRLRYDFGEETYIGAISTSRIFNGAYNAMQGADFKYLFWKNYYVKLQCLYSVNKELDQMSLFDNTRKFGHTDKDAAFNGESFNGTAMRLSFARYTRNHNIDLVYRDVSPAFVGQSSFINVTDNRNLNVEYSYTMYPDSIFINQANVFCSTGMTWNHESVQKEKYIFLGTNVQFKKQIFLFIAGMPVNEERYHNVNFRDILRVNANLFARPITELSIGIWVEAGKFIYRDDVPELGKGHYAGIDLTLRPTEKLESTFNYSRARLANFHTNQLYYDLYILRNVSAFQFTQEFNLRLITEYSLADKYISIFPLASYKINPFTIFYIGATSFMERFDSHHGFLQTERQFFAKLQYLWNS